MKHLRTKFCATALLLAGAAVCSAASSVAIYAGGPGTVYRSTDGGLTWTTIGSGLGFSVTAIAADPTNPLTLYAGYAGVPSGVYKTVDGGVHWTAFTTGFTLAFGSPTVIVIDPTNTAVLYAGTGNFGNGVFKSTDGGATWTAINTGLMSNCGGCLDVHGLVMDPTHTSTLYVTGNTGLQSAKTIDGGLHWTSFTGSIPFGLAAVIDPVNPSIVYFGGYPGVYQTTDGGVTWSQGTGLNGALIGSTALDPATEAVYAGQGATGEHQVFKSTDFGHTWTAPGVGPAGGDLRTLLADPTVSGTLYAGTQGGIYLSTDSAATWSLSFAVSGLDTFASGPIATPLNTLPVLINTVQNLGSAGQLNGGQVNALLQKLQDALSRIQSDKTNVACNHLNAFVNQVAALVQGGVLTSAQGTELIQQAQAIMQLVPCQ